VKCVQGYVRCGLYGYLQLVIICVEDGIFPLLVHVTGVPQRTEHSWPEVQMAWCPGRSHLLPSPMR
jgi:hypothetical protein